MTACGQRAKSPAVQLHSIRQTLTCRWQMSPNIVAEAKQQGNRNNTQNCFFCGLKGSSYRPLLSFLSRHSTVLRCWLRKPWSGESGRISPHSGGRPSSCHRVGGQVRFVPSFSGRQQMTSSLCLAWTCSRILEGTSLSAVLIRCGLLMPPASACQCMRTLGMKSIASATICTTRWGLGHLRSTQRVPNPQGPTGRASKARLGRRLVILAARLCIRARMVSMPWTTRVGCVSCLPNVSCLQSLTK